MLNKLFKLSDNSKKNRKGVDDRLIEISDLAIKITTIDFGIPTDGGIRSMVRQNQLYIDGKSKADGISNKSNHQDGNALDFYAYVDGKASWKKEHLAIVAAAHLQAASMLGYRLNWGGLWKYVDMPHIELA